MLFEQVSILKKNVRKSIDTSKKNFEHVSILQKVSSNKYRYFKTCVRTSIDTIKSELIYSTSVHTHIVSCTNDASVMLTSSTTGSQRNSTYRKRNVMCILSRKHIVDRVRMKLVLC